MILLRPGGTRHLVAELISLKAQLIVTRRKISQAPSLTPLQKLVFAFCSFFMSSKTLLRSSIVVKPSTILKFHRWLVKRKYSKLYRNHSRKMGRPPISKELTALILQIKTNNASFGCPQIVALIQDRTGIMVSEETVGRTLMKFYRGTSGGGPSWLSFLGSQADSLWSIDLFCAESIFLKTYWIMVVMDQWSRKIIGFAVTKGQVTGEELCQMFNLIVPPNALPKRISHDHDPLFRFHQWTRNMDILGIEEIWTVPFVPISHPYVERLNETVRKELLDRILFYGEGDLLRKLGQYQDYFNKARVHSGIDGEVPGFRYSSQKPITISPKDLQWKHYCNGLFSVPIAA